MQNERKRTQIPTKNEEKNRKKKKARARGKKTTTAKQNIQA